MVEWENRLRDYGRSSPAGETIGESIEIVVVAQRASAQLRSHLQVNAGCIGLRSLIDACLSVHPCVIPGRPPGAPLHKPMGTVVWRSTPSVKAREKERAMARARTTRAKRTTHIRTTATRLPCHVKAARARGAPSSKQSVGTAVNGAPPEGVQEVPQVHGERPSAISRARRASCRDPPQRVRWCHASAPRRAHVPSAANSSDDNWISGHILPVALRRGYGCRGSSGGVAQAHRARRSTAALREERHPHRGARIPGASRCGDAH